jgi:hypothetical protein
MRTLLLFLCLCVLACGCKKKSQPTSDDTPSAKSDVPSSDPGKPVVPVIPTRPTRPPGWVEFKHPDGAFTVYLPNSPRPIKVSAGSNLKQPVPVGRMLMSDYATDKAGILYCEVGVAIYSPELVDGVKAAREQRGPVIIGPVRKRASVTWCGHPAFEDTAEDPERPGLVVQRSMWVSNRLYYCTVYGHEAGRPTAEERAAAFDSFTIGN